MRHTTPATRSRGSSRQISPHLSASAAGITAAGIATGVIEYLHRSPIREAHLPGTSAWTPHLVAAAVAGALYGVARWRHGRRFGRGSGRLLLLAPLGRSAASRHDSDDAAGVVAVCGRAAAAGADRLQPLAGR